jgi:hypothetical protein
VLLLHRGEDVIELGIVSRGGDERLVEGDRDPSDAFLELTKRRTLRRLAISRSLSRLAVKKRPNDGPFLSFSIRSCQRPALLPIRSSRLLLVESLSERRTLRPKRCRRCDLEFAI